MQLVQATQEQAYGDIFLNFLSTGKTDSKAREIGFIVCFRDNGEDFRAYVQNARRVNGEWVDFGVRQRSRSFPSQRLATCWAYATAQVRIHKVKNS
jgi:hypothetical protein